MTTLREIVVGGISIGSVYAVVAIAYNFMYESSRVVSFTSGQVAMLGAVIGAFLLTSTSVPVGVALVLTVLAGSLYGILTEFLCARTTIRYVEKHLYVMSTLAVAIMTTQLVAIFWGTEPRNFPAIAAFGGVSLDPWLPLITLVGVVLFERLVLRRTAVGLEIRAIAQDRLAAVAAGVPETRARIFAYGLAGVVGSLVGFTAGHTTYAFFALGDQFTFYGFIPVAIAGFGSYVGAGLGGIFIGILLQGMGYLVGGAYESAIGFGVFLLILLLFPHGIGGSRHVRREV